MRRIIGAAFVSLDGVMQAPGGTSEDSTGGFTQEGWLAAVGDEAIDATVGAVFGRPYDLLLGRRTYDIFAAYWPYVEGEMKPLGEAFDRCTKYVVTRGSQPLDWQNSERVSGVDAIRALKQGDGPDLVIQGSTTLYPPLLAAGLIDRLTLMTAPVVIGSGKRWFGEGTAPATMRMVDHQVGSKGCIVATYEPAGPVVLQDIGPLSTSAAEAERQARIKAGTW
ncbi:dihydrofolate reductase family protein [Sphingomonas sp. KRR8]|uniref:dihydrofolate reductase family protein n=1 Tax=Sphingomonas sp. KRR8 TaxID=2942996 RepID=UPI002020AB98|nr:dihydrofolate reductase family protein [Sphingomonas sp. KRR8]URD60025.1 dihydrofolate reductase family protein [Sphingomonas sp. KRR8]